MPWAERQSALEDCTGAGDGSRDTDGAAEWRTRARRQPAAPRDDAATRREGRDLAGLARRPGARRVRGHRRTQSVDAPARGRRPRAQRPAHRRLDGHGLGQVAVLPPARAAGDRVRARPQGPARGQRSLSRSHQGPRPGPARRPARLDLPDLRCATHDGDSTPEMREWTRDHAEYVLTNPDMLHRSLLPGHARWSRFFGSLRYVVVDECHHYRGVFGAHVAQILRRLRRVAALYGAHPTFVLASATVAEPQVSAGRLTGLEVVAVTDDGSPRGRMALALWEPPFVPGVGENGAPVRRSATSEVADLLTDLVVDRVRTLAFVRSRRGAETVALTARRLLGEVDPALVDQVAAYRGGYLPEERRELEEALRSGRLLGLAATNALELGIDISGLDAVLLAGFPGTRAALWQQVGRAGRGARDALGGAGRARRPARHLPRQPPRGPARPAGRGQRLRPRQPLRARAAPVRGRRGVTADGGRPPALRPRCTNGRRRADRGWPAPPPPARLVLDRPTASQRPRRHPLLGRYAGPAGRVRDRSRARHRRPLLCPRHRAHRGGLPPPGRDLAGHRPRPRRVGGRRRARRPRLLDLGPRDHRHRDPAGTRGDRVGGGAAEPRRRAGDPPGGLVPQAGGAERRGDRRGAARPARASAPDHRRVVDPARARARRVRR